MKRSFSLHIELFSTSMGNQLRSACYNKNILTFFPRVNFFPLTLEVFFESLFFRGKLNI